MAESSRGPPSRGGFSGGRRGPPRRGGRPPAPRVVLTKDDLVGIAHIHASKNNTIVHVTDVTGSETLAIASGGHIVKSGSQEKKPWTAMKVAEKVADECFGKGITAIHIRIRAPGGNKSKIPGIGNTSAVRALSRSRLKILSIDEVTPVPTDSCRAKGGRRGRRL